MEWMYRTNQEQFDNKLIHAEYEKKGTLKANQKWCPMERG